MASKTVIRSDALPADLPPVLATKVEPPAAREHEVARRRLHDRLRPDPGVRLTVVAAPAGYGKTTLLGMWREIEAARRPVAWVTLDARDNDAVVLWSHVLQALNHVCPAVGALGPRELMGAGRIKDMVLPNLVNELTEAGDVTLILDDFHQLSDCAARESVTWLVEHAPATVQLVVASRSEPALRLAALRGHGELLELHADELSFTSEEAETLLNERLQLDLSQEDVDDLVRRTEGWPAGLYLAALSLHGTDDARAFIGTFGGTNRAVVDLLVDEVLDAHDPALQALMLRCSVLDRLSGPLCDAVLDEDGVGELLRELSRTNLFLRPLDHHGEWYRFHRVFAQLLRVELEHREPDVVATLHRRAFAWHRDHGSVDDAVRHAIEAGAFAEARELIARAWIGELNAGRCATVLGWLQRFPRDMVHEDPQLLTVQAWMLSLCARHEEATRTIAAAEQLFKGDDRPLLDGFGSAEASLATLKAALPWGDIGTGLHNAVRAAELEHSESPVWPMVCWAVGVGLYFSGYSDDAERWFNQCSALGEHWHFAASSLAYRSIIAGERGRRDEQAALAEQALALTRERGVEETHAEAQLAMAMSFLDRGEPAAARPLADRGVDIARSFGQPVSLAYALIRQAKVLRTLDERDAAAAALEEATTIVASCRDPGTLRACLESFKARPPRRPKKPSTTLSDRERIVLRMLTGPLSERDIGRELYLSHNTIHSHTRSIYRKLGVRSRREAIGLARQLGLL